jgi:hypothetical protein
VQGLSDLPWYGRAATVGAVMVMLVSLFVGYKLSGDTFGQAVPWASAGLDTEVDQEALSFATHELETAVQGEGSILTTEGGPLYAEGKAVTVTAQPQPGAEFVGWEGDLTGDSNPTVIEMDGDKRLTAVFMTDVTAPTVSDLAVETWENRAVVSWTTDEPATSRVSVGSSAAYEIGVYGGDNLSRNHHVTVTGLVPGAEHHYAVSSTNGADLTATTADSTFVAPATSGPALDVWGGPRQVVGINGDPQMWVNVHGNVSDPDGVSSLSYSLNGGAARELTVGPDNRRLQAEGDFNADLAYDDLADGDNQVVLTATDQAGRTSSSTVVIERRRSEFTLPYSTDWSDAARIGDQGQIVDGRWQLDGDTIRPLEMGYDRVVAVGDMSMHDYEVTVSVKVNGLGPGNGSYLSGSSLPGIALNWRGHTQVRDEQPGYYYYPTGALAWFRFFEGNPRFELRGNDDDPIVRNDRFDMSFGRSYMWKAQSRTVEGGVQYSWKVWPQGTPESAYWDMTITEPDGPETGAVALIAHQADVQFGDVTITPLPPEDGDGG